MLSDRNPSIESLILQKTTSHAMATAVDMRAFFSCVEAAWWTMLRYAVSALM